tara:strand:+ start:264 stop:557 length:294 start_codon:yes stop_codon:yes gene_type:complete
MKDKKPLQVSIDGVRRSQVNEDKLNNTILSCFLTDAGAETLRYLRSITIESVAGFNISDQELRQREGMRFLVGIIEQRIKEGKNVRARESNKHRTGS